MTTWWIYDGLVQDCSIQCISNGVTADLYLAIHILSFWDSLTHWPLGDGADILKVYFSNSSYRIVARAHQHFEIVLRWMPENLTLAKSTLVQVMAWCHQATSHYLSQCWPRSMSPYGTRPQWVNLHSGKCLSGVQCQGAWTNSDLLSSENLETKLSENSIKG